MWVRTGAKKPPHASLRPALRWRLSPSNVAALQGFPAMAMRKVVFAANELAADTFDCGLGPTIGTSMNIVLTLCTRASRGHPTQVAPLRVAVAAPAVQLDAL
jgi:hypothetical protein